MITLATLHKATAQEVFNKVSKHLLTQGRRSLDDSEIICQYHGGGNTQELKCAVGCLISGEEYEKRGGENNLEGKSWETLVNHFDLPKDHFDLISDLQDVHDYIQPVDWKTYLNLVAKKYYLNGID